MITSRKGRFVPSTELIRGRVIRPFQDRAYTKFVYSSLKYLQAPEAPNLVGLAQLLGELKASMLEEEFRVCEQILSHAQTEPADLHELEREVQAAAKRIS